MKRGGRAVIGVEAVLALTNQVVGLVGVFREYKTVAIAICTAPLCQSEPRLILHLQMLQ